MPRKKLDIDPKTVKAFARLGATNVEIAHFFGCDEGTIRKRFSEILRKGRSARKVKLRQRLWKAAMDGNAALLIFLAKNDLGMMDAPEKNRESGDAKPPPAVIGFTLPQPATVAPPPDPLPADPGAPDAVDA